MFPLDNYTPYGYLDNPFHTWKLNRSGVIRVNPPCGFGWIFLNAHSQIYRSSLNVGFQFDNLRLLFLEDFTNHQISLKTSYHSKNLFRFDWYWQDIDFDVEFFLAEEHALAAKIGIHSLTNLSTRLSILLLQSVYLDYRKTGLWDFGLTGRYDEKLNAGIIKSFAEGYCFLLKPSTKCQSYYFSEDLKNFQSKLPKPGQTFCSTTNSTLFGLIEIPVQLSKKNSIDIECVLTRSMSENHTLRLANSYLPKVSAIREKKIKTDTHFWIDCPRLEGDWPDYWKGGWIYDWETLRMNVRDPVGIFSTRWDAMQIQKPRIVLAETALDMLMMSYAHPEISQEVTLGLFKDATSPQIPCAREDGSLNMISADGSECGTSPAWCFPFYCFESIVMRHYNRSWLKQLYPFLVRYLNWWLQNRVDEEGWAVYNCSWESGQDASNKFLIPQATGGEIVSHLRSVDLQAAMAQSASILSFFAKCLNIKNSEWDGIAQHFEKNVHAMWQGDWFCDFDKRTQSWINNSDYRDITNLAPIFCGYFKVDQLEKLKLLLGHFETNPKLWLEWASFFFMYLEACWQVAFKQLSSRILFTTVERVYRNWDQRSWQENKSMPGISVECWGLDKPYGAEGYGWAATLPLHIIRSLIGFRECKPDFRNSFWLCPNFPDQLMLKGKSYSINPLKFQDKRFSVCYTVRNERNLNCIFSCEASGDFRIQLRDQNQKVIRHFDSSTKILNGEFEVENRKNYQFEFFVSDL